MKLDFSQVLLDAEDSPLKGVIDGKEKVMTLSVAVMMATSQPSEGLTPLISLERFKLAVAAGKKDEQEVDDALLPELRKAVFHKFNGHPMVYGRVCELVGEPTEAEVKIKSRVVRQPLTRPGGA